MTDTPAAAAPSGSTTGATTAVTAPAPGTPVVAPAAQGATRFHATKALDNGRPVRDISQISDKILTPLLAANGVAFTITLDIESSGLERLTPDQVVALRENLKTLGFTDYSVE